MTSRWWSFKSGSLSSSSGLITVFEVIFIEVFGCVFWSVKALRLPFCSQSRMPTWQATMFLCRHCPLCPLANFRRHFPIVFCSEKIKQRQCPTHTFILGRFQFRSFEGCFYFLGIQIIKFTAHPSLTEVAANTAILLSFSGFPVLFYSGEIFLIIINFDPVFFLLWRCPWYVTWIWCLTSISLFFSHFHMSSFWIAWLHLKCILFFLKIYFSAVSRVLFSASDRDVISVLKF